MFGIELLLLTTRTSYRSSRNITTTINYSCSGVFFAKRQHSSSSSSSKRWQARQSKDRFTREATVQGLKSRAAFKLLQIDEKFHIFKPGQTVVDLGYAPGSWSQVAVSRTQPNGRVLGVDIIPAQPPKGVSTIQGNFLAPEIQDYVREFLRDPQRGRPRSPSPVDIESYGSESTDTTSIVQLNAVRREEPDSEWESGLESNDDEPHDTTQERTVDVVLSDMSAPWFQTTGFWKKSLSQPYRMMNTSGMSFRDHAGSMDLCRAALQFGFDTLRPGGHFVCKFYQGAEDKDLEGQLRKLFQKVHRLKPESSRSESKEAFFVALGRMKSASRDDVLAAP